MNLKAWVERNGALGNREVALIGVLLGHELTRMPRRVRRQRLGSLTLSHLHRSPEGWVWRPQQGELKGSDERAVVVALAGLLMQARQLDDGGTAKDGRRVERELPVGAVLERGAAGELRSLGDFCEQLSVAADLPMPTAGRAWGWIAAGVVALVFAGVALIGGYADPMRDGWGFTRTERHAFQALREAAIGAAWTGEQGSALRRLEEATLLLRQRVDAGDPRIALLNASKARVQQLNRDWLTAEQLAEFAAANLQRSVGKAHPYTATAIVLLEVARQQRGAAATADRVIDTLPPELALPRAAASSGDGTEAGGRLDHDADGDGISDALEPLLHLSAPAVRPWIMAHVLSNWEPDLVVAHMAGNEFGVEGFVPLAKNEGGAVDAWLPPTVAGRARHRGWTLLLQAGKASCVVKIDLGAEHVWRIRAPRGVQAVADWRSGNELMIIENMPAARIAGIVPSGERLYGPDAQLPSPAVRVLTPTDDCQLIRFAVR